ncbi:MAG TPA: MqnA/MqnD/SBP family protein [Limnochordia bacterium]|nr:MqnA/MqnD/SBP family protein [Limnochordia bacterium]
MSVRRLRIGHSPDADDALMIWPLVAGRVAIPGFTCEAVPQDIESLNQRARSAELEVTAMSAGAYPYLCRRYRIMHCGASFGLGYGPIVVANRETRLEALAGARIAVPGEWTTAYLVARLLLPAFEPVQYDFDAVAGAVTSGAAAAGVLIHEGQITYAAHGLVKLLDLGAAWHEETGLPLPLGLDCVRRDLGERACEEVARARADGIRYALDHLTEAVAYANSFGRGLDAATVERFALMYVNQLTTDMGEVGRQALSTLYARAHAGGLIPAVPPIDLA